MAKVGDKAEMERKVRVDEKVEGAKMEEGKSRKCREERSS